MPSAAQSRSSSSLQSTAVASLGYAARGESLRCPVKKIDGQLVGEANLPPEIFGREHRPDLMHAYVKWQDARRHIGQHKTQTRNEVSRTSKKMYKQKGTGGARHGSRRAAQFVGGAKAHGPVLRQAEPKLPKKVRTLALLNALSARARTQRVQVLDEYDVDTHKTADLHRRLSEMGLKDVLIVTANDGCDNLKLASRNLPYVDLLPIVGLNVRSILLRDDLVLTTEALHALGERYDVPIDLQINRSAVGRYSPEGGYAEERALTSVAEHRARIVRAQDEAAGRREPREVRLAKRRERRDMWARRWTDRSSVESASESFPPDEQPITGTELRSYARTLRLGAGVGRMEVMKTLRSNPPRGPWNDEMVRRLLPLVVSDDAEEARAAAETLCALRYQDSALSADHLATIMHDEGVDFVTYVDALKSARGARRLKFRVRLSSALPLKIGDDNVRLEVPAWLERARSFTVRVSGPSVRAETIAASHVDRAEGDMLAEVVEFDLAATGNQEVLFDFYADNRWLDRQTLKVAV